MHVGRQVGLGVERLSLARLQPLGIDVQFLNQDVAVARREARAPGLDHRKGCLADSKSLCQLLLRHAELLAYQFYPLVHRLAIGIFDSKKLCFRA